MSSVPHPPPSGFDGFVFRAAEEIPRVRSEIPVYVTGPADRPGVIVMHEAGGMSPTCLDLARDLAADNGFRVFLPLLFGKPNQERRSGVDMNGLFCMRREMLYWAADATSPITGLIRQLVVEVGERTGRPKVGVIGMCLTGNLTFGLMAEPNVGAVIAAEPSLPLVMPVRRLRWLTRRHKRAALSLSPADLAASVRSRTPLLALRFEGDVICPVERFDALQAAFEGRDILTVDTLDGDGHSVLTRDRTVENDRVPRVRAFLTEHLDAG